MEQRSATKTFRQTVLLVSMALALITVILMASGFPDCSTANLYFAMAMIFFVYSVVFIMMLLQFIGLVSCLKTIPRAIMGFYFVLVATMFYVQMILFKGDNCSTESPVLFFWLVSQVVIFYFIVAFGLAKWGSYICWQAENHDQMAKKAVDDYFKKMKNKQHQLMIEHDDKKQPLLSSEDEEYKYSDEDESDNERRSKKKSKINQNGVLAIGN